jgi:two-component system, sensor histidine kinase PdtaS
MANNELLMEISQPQAANRHMLAPDAFDGIPLAIVVASREGKIVLMNNQAERLFGYQRGALTGQAVECLIPARFREAHPLFRSHFLTSPLARPMGAGRDLFALRSDGVELPVEIGLNPIDTEQGPMVLAAVVDITERKHREEATRAALKEKEMLLGEIHHRVKNNLQIIHSLLDLQALTVEDPRFGDMLRESQGRLRSMALIHQTLYKSQDFAAVNFRLFLSELLPVLTDTYALAAEKIHQHVNAEGVRLTIATAIPCGLIVNELVANALKHGFPDGREGNIWIDITQSEGSVTLSISNDGVSLDNDFHIESGTLGMRLVHLLVEQLHGELEVHLADPVRFMVRFPLP